MIEWKQGFLIYLLYATVELYRLLSVVGKEQATHDLDILTISAEVLSCLLNSGPEMMLGQDGIRPWFQNHWRR